MRNFNFDYDEIEDIFYLGEKEKVKFSIDIALPSGDAVVDVGFDGLVKGLEIFNASKFFSVVSEELKKIKIAYFSLVYSPSYVSLNIKLKSKGGIIQNSVIIPYSRRVILED